MYYIPEEEYILVFATHNHAVFLYRKLTKLGCSVELISTPCRLSAGCTQALKFKHSCIDIVKGEVEEGRIITRGIYKISCKGGRTNYIPL